jgi:D-amino peptidase
MRLYIIADMEGASGVVHRDDLMEDGTHHWQRARGWLTGDVNAAIEGAASRGVTEVVVSEGHAHMRNLILDDLDPRAVLVRGPARWENRPLCQAAGLEPGHDLAFLIAFHSRAGTPGGLLSHTWAGAIVHSLHLNGQEVGETAINAAILADHGVPVALVTGADDVCREAAADLPGVGTAEVKRALGFDIAACPPPSATAPRIRTAAARAVERVRAGELRPFQLRSGPGCTATLSVHKRQMADKMVMVPGLERTGERELTARASSASDALSAVWRGVAAAFHEPAGWLR